MISQLHPDNVNVLSLTTIASPHRGSYFADFLIEEIGPNVLPKLYKFLNGHGVKTGAFSQLTQKYMQEEFNPKTPDAEGTRYFSYGATFEPRLLSPFRRSHRIVQEKEGPNDGLVSVQSARWGTYKGTLINVSHLDMINWTNRLRFWAWKLVGVERK
jgi:triacylglycerol lipase